jgi:hypothetical protein
MDNISNCNRIDFAIAETPDYVSINISDGNKCPASLVTSLKYFLKQTLLIA